MAVREWQTLTSSDFDKSITDQTIVLLPIGATEQHGSHLPVGTDDILVRMVVDCTLPFLNDDLDIVVLPPLWCSKSNEHLDFPGTISLRTETMLALLEDISDSVKRSGLHKLVLLNWHGGNTELLGAAARDIRVRHNLLVVVIDCLRLAAQVARNVFGDAASFGLHAGRGETSLMLASEEDVHQAHQTEVDTPTADNENEYVALQRQLGPFGDAVNVGWKASDLTTNGVIGDLEDASREEGEMYLEAISNKVAEILTLVAALKIAS